MTDTALVDQLAETPAPATGAPAAPPADLVNIIAQAVSVYAAAKAGGKDWWRSKGMWGSLLTVASSAGAAIALAFKVDPTVVASVVAAIGAIGGALSGVGRATAVGPIR